MVGLGTHRPRLRTRAPDSFLWQNIFGVWPVDGTVTDELRERLHAYAEKAIREAALHTTWNDPDTDFESAVHSWLDAVLDGPVAAELTSLVARLDEHARSDALGQKLIALTAPGVPGRLPGHRVVGGQPGRSGQPQARRLRRPAGRADATRPPQAAGGSARRCGCAASGRTPSSPAATARCSPTAPPPSTSWRSCAATTCWWRSAGGRVRLAETGWGEHHSDASRRDVDRPADRPHATADGCGRGPVRRPARSRCWSVPMTEHEFAVWAPRPERVRLDVDGTLHPMTRSDDGWWRADVDAAPDARYGFVLDDDPKVLPDPRSPRQPDGVHERSQLWQPAADAWTDADWQGRSIEGAVIYELHIGTFTPAGTFDSAIDKLDYLVDLGVDFVELMPVNAFGGTHGWGYDGVLWYAVHEPYGGPDGLVRLDRRLPRPRPRRADRRGVQPPRPVGQLPAAVRPVPVVGQQPVGRVDQHRRRRRRRGAALHHRLRAALDARLPRRRTAPGRRARAGRHHGDPHPRGAVDRNRCAGSRTGPSAVADRRERPQRPAADHAARPRRLRDDRAVGRRHPPRDPHRGVRANGRATTAISASLETLAHDAEARLLPRGHLLVVPAPPARPAAGHRDDPGDPAAGLHADPRPGRQPGHRRPARRRT